MGASRLHRSGPSWPRSATAAAPRSRAARSDPASEAPSPPVLPGFALAAEGRQGLFPGQVDLEADSPVAGNGPEVRGGIPFRDGNLPIDCLPLVNSSFSPTVEAGMFFRQLLDDDTACASYLFGC